MEIKAFTIDARMKEPFCDFMRMGRDVARQLKQHLARIDWRCENFYLRMKAHSGREWMTHILSPGGGVLLGTFIRNKYPLAMFGVLSGLDVESEAGTLETWQGVASECKMPGTEFFSQIRKGGWAGPVLISVINEKAGLTSKQIEEIAECTSLFTRLFLWEFCLLRDDAN